MTDPYRSAPSGGPCLRCRKPMDLDASTGDLRCTAGCGSWISAKAIDALIAPEVVKREARGNPFKATPFLPAWCPHCKAKTLLEDLYAGTQRVISFGRCIEHGLWIDQGARSDFETAYAAPIAAAAATRDSVDARVRQLDADVEAFAAQLAGDATIDRRELARRVIVLERAIVDQAKRLERLERALARPSSE